jgi:hypothetical protein
MSKILTFNKPSRPAREAEVGELGVSESLLSDVMNSAD